MLQSIPRGYVKSRAAHGWGDGGELYVTMLVIPCRGPRLALYGHKTIANFITSSSVGIASTERADCGRRLPFHYSAQFEDRTNQ